MQQIYMEIQAFSRALRVRSSTSLDLPQPLE